MTIEQFLLFLCVLLIGWFNVYLNKSALDKGLKRTTAWVVYFTIFVSSVMLGKFVLETLL